MGFPKCTSLHAWRLPKQESSIAPDTIWSNADQDPVPQDKRTWGPWAFVGYWFSDLVTISTWEVGSSVLSAGLGTRDAILIMLIAGISNMIPTVLNGAIGSRHNIPFPIAIRASYGYYFSIFCIVSRAILAAFWLGVQSVGGGQAVTQAIICIWPSYANLPNQLPASAMITTQGMLSYFIFHVIQFGFLLVPTYKLQQVFLIKSILIPPMAIGILIWVCLKANGANAILNQPRELSGSAYAWAWLATMTSVTGGFSTLAVNIPDFSRFSKTSNAQLWQVPAIPILKIVTALFGIVATGAARVAFNEDLWSPIELIAKWEGSGGRFLGFVCCALWVLAQVCCNVSANSVSFSNDLTTLLPKYINLRRGAIIGVLFGGFALVPWIMVSSAAVFLLFMSGYAVFLAPMAGILCCDYFLVRRAKLDVPSLYDPRGRYRYNKFGTNWRALVVMIVILAPLLPGLAYSISPSTVSVNSGIVHIYDISWLYGFHTSIALYWILSVVFPPRDTFVQMNIPAFPTEIEGIEPSVEAEVIEITSKV